MGLGSFCADLKLVFSIFFLVPVQPQASKPLGYCKAYSAVYYRNCWRAPGIVLDNRLRYAYSFSDDKCRQLYLWYQSTPYPSHCPPSSYALPHRPDRELLHCGCSIDVSVINESWQSGTVLIVVPTLICFPAFPMFHKAIVTPIVSSILKCVDFVKSHFLYILELQLAEQVSFSLVTMTNTCSSWLITRFLGPWLQLYNTPSLSKHCDQWKWDRLLQQWYW